MPLRSRYVWTSTSSRRPVTLTKYKYIKQAAESNESKGLNDHENSHIVSFSNMPHRSVYSNVCMGKPPRTTLQQFPAYSNKYIRDPDELTNEKSVVATHSRHTYVRRINESCTKAPSVQYVDRFHYKSRSQPEAVAPPLTKAKPGFTTRITESIEKKIVSRYKIRSLLARRQSCDRFHYNSRRKSSTKHQTIIVACEAEQTAGKIVSRYKTRRCSRSKPQISKFTATHYRKHVNRAVNWLVYRRQPICPFYSKTGKCSAANKCPLSHDPSYLRICPRFLCQTCPLGSDDCPLAHVLDPCRLPACEFYQNGECTRVPCPYLHVLYPPNTPTCTDFLRGRCPRGRSCKKQHVLAIRSSRLKYHVQIDTRGKDESTAPSRSKPSDSSVPTPPPKGSLRYAHPAPQFIPLNLYESLTEDNVTADPTDA